MTIGGINYIMPNFLNSVYFYNDPCYNGKHEKTGIKKSGALGQPLLVINTAETNCI